MSYMFIHYFDLTFWVICIKIFSLALIYTGCRKENFRTLLTPSHFECMVTRIHSHFLVFQQLPEPRDNCICGFIAYTSETPYDWHFMGEPIKNIIYFEILKLKLTSPRWCGSVDWVLAHASLILCHGTCLGCGPGTWLGAGERQPIHVSPTHRCFSPSLPPFPSLK